MAQIVNDLMSETLKDIKEYVNEDNEKLIESLQNEMEKSQQKNFSNQKQRLTECETRISELERLMCRIYEDMMLEKIPESRYEILNNQYEIEQKSLDDIKNSKKMLNSDNLTTTIINEFVEKIIVHEIDGNVIMELLGRVCEYFHCDVGDIVSYKFDE